MELKLEELKSLVSQTSSGNLSHSLVVGEKYFIRTVLFYYTGRIKSITDTDIVLSDAAWNADTGRFADALKNGVFNEVEPFCDDVILQRGSIVDVTRWNHVLPNEQK